jgi:signal transduction histidine kinase
VSIRLKLTFWFIVAALVPAAFITIFAAGEAGERFNSRALLELEQATTRGLVRLEELKKEITIDLNRLLKHPQFEVFHQNLLQNPLVPSDPFFARDFSDEFDVGFDYLSFMDENGIVLSSREWPVFAGKRDLQWEILQSAQSGECLVGPVETSSGKKLALRAVERMEGLLVAGGITVDESLVSLFETSARLQVFISDAVTDSIFKEDSMDQEPTEELEILLAEVDSEIRETQLFLHSREYYFDRISLSNANPEFGAVAFLYPRAELDEEISGIWITFLLAAAAGLVIAVLLGVVVSSRVGTPLRKLVYGFDLVALGDFGHRLRSGRNDEIGDLFNAYNRMTEDLDSLRRQLVRTERVAAWQEIARKIAHEIKNPLSPIQISIETLRKVYERSHPDFKSIFRESTATILEEVEKIRNIVQEFSDFARMPEPEYELVDLKEVIGKAVRLFKPQLGNAKLELRLDDVPQIEADPEQLHRALVNLIGNALDAIGGSGSLSITLEQMSSRTVRGRKRGKTRFLKISVVDDGPGVSEEDMQKVFTPYFTTKEDGTGLGLVIVQKIIEQHKGRLNFRSAQGGGTAVEIILPGA